ncbi:MAG: Gfo/Idh/MocA family oxidoreductase [Pirellulaceae bacterium]|nr:Gfo/Idh/MocA family oxidoreductase [Planctomycetaceae bacterium]HIM31488.1 Gfo/Idh/MocA family oxidoreductase [Planctomycetota bacterium]
MKLRLGIIGLGDAWESRHRPALKATSDRFEIRAICDRVAVLAETAARDFGAVVVDGYQALAAREDVDAVMMLAPDWYGPLPILAASDHGKAVYCATSLDLEADRVVEIRKRVEEAGVAFMAEFPRRTMPATLRLKELIATRLGQPRLLFCHERLPPPPKKVRYDSHRPFSSGLREMMELVDWCRYVVDSEPSSVSCVQHRQVEGEPAKHDYRMLSLDFSDGEYGTGPLAQISYGRYLRATWPEAASFRPPCGLQVCCENGVAFIDLPATLVWFDEAGQHIESLDSERPVGEQLLIQFHRAVTSLVRKTTDMDDAFRTLHIVQQSAASFASGQRIILQL